MEASTANTMMEELLPPAMIPIKEHQALIMTKVIVKHNRILMFSIQLWLMNPHLRYWEVEVAEQPVALEEALKVFIIIDGRFRRFLFVPLLEEMGSVLLF